MQEKWENRCWGGETLLETRRPSEDDPPLDRDFTCQEDNVTYEASSLGPLKEKEIKNKSQHFFGCFFYTALFPQDNRSWSQSSKTVCCKTDFAQFSDYILLKNPSKTAHWVHIFVRNNRKARLSLDRKWPLPAEVVHRQCGLASARAPGRTRRLDQGLQRFPQCHCIKSCKDLRKTTLTGGSVKKSDLPSSAVSLPLK